MKCCLCGSGRKVRWCEVCSHYFCLYHRYALWGRVERTAAAVKAILLQVQPSYCAHGKGEK